MKEYDNRDRSLIHSEIVKAGKRTYIFDVKATRESDYFLTITEVRSKRIGDSRTETTKHTIFLYKEDFAKFAAGFVGALQVARNLLNEKVANDSYTEPEEYEDQD